MAWNAPSSQDGSDRSEGPVSRGALAVSLSLHAAMAGAIWAFGACTSKPPAETLKIVEMTIVLPEDVADEPLPEPPPKPKEDPPPVLDDKLDAVERIVEPPKPPEPPKPKEEEKPKPPDPPKPKPKVTIKPPDPSKLKHGPKPGPKPPVPTSPRPPKVKPLSAAEIARALSAGARPGDTNSLPANENERCVGVIYRACREEWEQESFTWYPGLRAGIVEITFSSNRTGAISKWRLVGKTGSAEVDNTITRAMNRLKKIPGLTPDFIKAYPKVTVEFAPTGR